MFCNYVIEFHEFIVISPLQPLNNDLQNVLKQRLNDIFIYFIYLFFTFCSKCYFLHARQIIIIYAWRMALFSISKVRVGIQLFVILFMARV